MLGLSGIPLPLLIGLTAVIAYFCGCFNGAVIVSKYILRNDVRKHGSGNAGLTNFFRTFGGPLTFVVILTDVLKAVVAILVARELFTAGYTDFLSAADATAFWRTFADYWAALFCLLGHMFPCMFHFKGGEGHPLWRHYCYYDRLEDRSGGLGRLPDPYDLDAVCLPRLLLGRGQFSLCHLVCLSGPGDYLAVHCDRWTDSLETPDQYPAVAERQ